MKKIKKGFYCLSLAVEPLVPMQGQLATEKLLDFSKKIRINNQTHREEILRMQENNNFDKKIIE